AAAAPVHQALQGVRGILRPLSLQLAIHFQTQAQRVAQVVDSRPADLPGEALDAAPIDPVDLRRLAGRETARPGDLRPERVAEVPGQTSQKLDRVLSRAQEGPRNSESLSALAARTLGPPPEPLLAPRHIAEP